MASLHAPRWTGAGLWDSERGGGVETLCVSAGRETYVFWWWLVVGLLRPMVGAGVPGVCRAAGRPRAVDAESCTGPGGRAASYIMVVGGMDGAEEVNNTTTIITS